MAIGRARFALGAFLASTDRAGIDDETGVAAEVEQFVKEVKQLAPSWEPDSLVSILDHPHPGSAPWRWVYCQLLFNIFAPEAQARLALDVIVPETKYAYRFDGYSLREIPIVPTSTRAPEPDGP